MQKAMIGRRKPAVSHLRRIERLCHGLKARLRCGGAVIPPGAFPLNDIFK